MNKIGRIVIFPIDGLLVICKVVDIKPGYGRDFYKLIPIAGSGEKWTSKVPGKELEWAHVENEYPNIKLEA